MTDITVTATRVAAIDPIKADIRSYVAGATITQGQAVGFDTAGKLRVADADGTYKQFRGIALNGGVAGQAIDVLHEGEIAGFDVSGLNADVLVYLSNTAGALGTAAGSTSVIAGRVVVMNNAPTYTKVIRVVTKWLDTWA